MELNEILMSDRCSFGTVSQNFVAIDRVPNNTESRVQTNII